MSKTVAGLIQHCKDKLGTPLRLHGARGRVLTQTILDRLAWRIQAHIHPPIRPRPIKYIGQHCTDCSGLIPAGLPGTSVAATTITTRPRSGMSIDHFGRDHGRLGALEAWAYRRYTLVMAGASKPRVLIMAQKSRVSATPWQKVPETL